MTSTSRTSTRQQKKRPLVQMNNCIYDSLLWILSVSLDLFFREIHPRSSWKIPRKGPVIFVAAPHANQFVDPLILARTIRKEGLRRVAWLTAAKSMDRAFIGAMAVLLGSVPVERAMDAAKSAKGQVYLPDPENDPLLVRGVGTDFTRNAQIGGLLVLPKVNGTAASAEIAEIIGPEELRLKKPFVGDVAIRQITGKGGDDGDANSHINSGGFQGTKFSLAPKVDQTEVYDAVFETLSRNGCVGIFPEGGSHDRTELLPLKAGVAIMALGALAANPDSGLKIIPCGMNYFHAHKFRSRAVIEFGSPVEVPLKMVEAYKAGGNDRRQAIGSLLDSIYQGLVSVTVQAPDFETLMMIQAVRRLYNPTGKKLPLPTVVELNRRLIQGYNRHKDDPRIAKLKKDVMKYNKDLLALNLRDHQVEYAQMPLYNILGNLVYRLSQLLLLSGGVIPGLVLFSPVFITGKLISIKKSKEALAASSVKIEARDVIATWKLLVSMAFAPALYTLYTFMLTFWTWKNQLWGRVPDWVPLWAMVVFGYLFIPAITYAALRFGEIGMDIFKGLRPLFLGLIPRSNSTMAKLRDRRVALAASITDLVNELGPETFPDFDNSRIISDPHREGLYDESNVDQNISRQHRHRISDGADFDSPPASPTADQASQGFMVPPPSNASTGEGLHRLPSSMSFTNLADIGLFATRPTTPTRRRSHSRTDSSGGFPWHGLSPLTSDNTPSVPLDELNHRIRGAMRERHVTRKSRTSPGGWEFADSDAGSESGTSGFPLDRKDQ